MFTNSYLEHRKIMKQISKEFDLRSFTLHNIITAFIASSWLSKRKEQSAAILMLQFMKCFMQKPEI